MKDLGVFAKVRSGLILLVTLMSVPTAWSKDYSGGELYTLQEFRYGKFEARMKMAAASGTVSSMFLYQEGCEIPDGRPWVEVDIEVLGKNPNSFQSNIITGKAGAQKTSEKHHTVSPAADQAFHTYAIEWTPNYVRWTVDGVEVRKTETGVNDNKNQVANLTGTQRLHFNLWSSESAAWVGAFDESALPLFQFINWVKVYKYTPNQGEGGSDFTLDWTDNFDTFDSERWVKGDWTFDGNRVYLTEQNIYCKDGMMILALSRKGQESFTGLMPYDIPSLRDEDESDNTSLLSSLDGITTDVYVSRTLAKDKWYTLCLPFDVDLTAEGSLQGVTAKTLQGVTNEGSTVTLTFGDPVEKLEAGKPYIVKLPDGATDNIDKLLIEGATINKTLKDVAVSGGTFKGTYARVDWAAGTKNVLFLQNNQFFYPQGDAYVNAFRGYIVLEKDVPDAATAKVIVDFGDGEATEIEGIDNGQWTIDNGQLTMDNWFTLGGVHLDGKPAEKGIYIVNGKKVVVK